MGRVVSEPGILLGGYFREAEIENFGVAALGDENIGGLDVAMDDALGVRGIETVGDLDAEIENGFHFHRAAGDAMLESDAVEELHGDEGCGRRLRRCRRWCRYWDD